MEIKQSHKVAIKNVKVLATKEIETEKEFKKAITKLAKFLRRLEKNFKEIAWYIGTHNIKVKPLVEKFIFDKTGYMEIILGPKAEIKAFFTKREKALKFIRAINKTSKKYGQKLGSIKLSD